MANLRDGIEETQENNQGDGGIQVNNSSVNFMLTAEECKFLLSKIAGMDFKGVEIEFVYNLIMKLQETYKNLSNDK
tara:strand:+ start:2500 stop:2727 length:228 start_codon:yes stop_codon:yes gene_type:complete